MEEDLPGPQESIISPVGKRGSAVFASAFYLAILLKVVVATSLWAAVTCACYHVIYCSYRVNGIANSFKIVS